MDNKINKFILYLRKIFFMKINKSNDGFEDILTYSINNKNINTLEYYNIISFDEYYKQSTLNSFCSNLIKPKYINLSISDYGIISHFYININVNSKNLDLFKYLNERFNNIQENNPNYQKHEKILNINFNKVAKKDFFKPSLTTTINIIDVKLSLLKFIFLIKKNNQDLLNFLCNDIYQYGEGVFYLFNLTERTNNNGIIHKK